MKKVRNDQTSVSINSCSELSKTQFFPVSTMKASKQLTVTLKKSIFMAEQAMTVHKLPVFLNNIQTPGRV